MEAASERNATFREVLWYTYETGSHFTLSPRKGCQARDATDRPEGPYRTRADGDPVTVPLSSPTRAMCGS